MPLFFRTLIGLHSAYIDPNVGGWLFQLIFPVLVAIGGFGVVLRRRIMEFWHRCFGPVETKPAPRYDKASPNDRALPPDGQSSDNRGHFEHHHD